MFDGKIDFFMGECIINREGCTTIQPLTTFDLADTTTQVTDATIFDHGWRACTLLGNGYDLGIGGDGIEIRIFHGHCYRCGLTHGGRGRIYIKQISIKLPR